MRALFFIILSPKSFFSVREHNGAKSLVHLEIFRVSLHIKPYIHKSYSSNIKGDVPFIGSAYYLFTAKNNFYQARV